MSFKERLELENNEFQVLKKKYSFNNIQRVKETLKENKEDISENVEDHQEVTVKPNKNEK